MTFARPSRTALRKPPAAPRRLGFTLVELLIVIGIIAVLAGILIPTIAGVVRSGKRTAQRQALAGIERALDAYQGDHNDIPRFGSNAAGTFNDADDTPDRGARLLARALFGPADAVDTSMDADDYRTETPANKSDLFQDGFDGFGFKGQRQVVPSAPGSSTYVYYTPGETYGPYLEPDRWDLGDDDGDPAAYSAATVILDNNGLPILYYPARRETPPPAQYIEKLAIAQANTNTRFNADDNRLFPATQADATSSLPTSYSATDAADLTFFNRLIGDEDESYGINDAEVPVDRPYLLIATGPEANSRGNLPDPTADYDAFLSAAGWEYARDAVTNFDESRDE